MRFYELAVGAVFTAFGRTYRKSAMSMAEDERGWASVFMGETEVTLEVQSAECKMQNEGGPVLPAEVAARWKPERGPWAGVIEGRFRRKRPTSLHPH